MNVPDSAGITLGGKPIGRLDEVAAEARTAAGDVALALALSRTIGREVPVPGRGETALRWSYLATLGATDLTVARAIEPHLDALAILAEQSDESDLAQALPQESTWGVYASEGPGSTVRARQRDQHSPGLPGGWTLDGVKPWCSLAEQVTHALITAPNANGERALYAVPLRQPGVRTAAEPWVSHGLRTIRSGPIQLAGAEATQVGPPGWYLSRDGFAWGGMGVAAVWFGGAVGLIRRMQLQAAQRPLDQIGQVHLGAADAALASAAALLRVTADQVDDGAARGHEGWFQCLRVRQVVADAAEFVLRCADHALGPAPLAHEAEHASRVSDLRIYLRQHHGERDAAALGTLVAERRPW